MTKNNVFLFPLFTVFFVVCVAALVAFSTFTSQSSITPAAAANDMYIIRSCISYSILKSPPNSPPPTTALDAKKMLKTTCDNKDLQDLKDIWGREMIYAYDTGNNRIILMSFGKNGEDDHGLGDDIIMSMPVSGKNFIRNDEHKRE